jgi:hypothetical protein
VGVLLVFASLIAPAVATRALAALAASRGAYLVGSGGLCGAGLAHFPVRRSAGRGAVVCCLGLLAPLEGWPAYFQGRT